MTLKPEVVVDAKGDLLVGRENNLAARLPVGADGSVLTADSTAQEGVSWSDNATSELASIEELTFSSTVISAISATTAVPMWVAPFACTIESCSLVAGFTSPGAGIPASDTDYWEFRLRRTRAADGSPNIAIKNTTAASGEAIAYRTEWNFDAVAFSETYKVLQKGDIIDMGIYKTGAPSNLTGIAITCRYQPT